MLTVTIHHSRFAGLPMHWSSWKQKNCNCIGQTSNLVDFLPWSYLTKLSSTDPRCWALH